MAAKKPSPAVELAGKMVQQLESQRSSDSYPLCLKRLAELADPQAPPELIVKAIGNKAFTERALSASRDRKDIDALVALADDANRLAASPQLLEAVLESICTEANPTVPIAKLSARVNAKLKQAFGRASTARSTRTLCRRLWVRFRSRRLRTFI
jgi:hypothetical protein